jgi:hypothetical protein
LGPGGLLAASLTWVGRTLLRGYKVAVKTLPTVPRGSKKGMISFRKPTAGQQRASRASNEPSVERAEGLGLVGMG